MRSLPFPKLTRTAENMIPLLTAHFESRAARSRFVAKKFSRYFQGSLLDVGCYEAPLRHLLKNARYTGIDVAGTPDIHVNLDAVSRLPFEDGQFSTVICIEVLEHLDNLHRIFDELIRVSGRYVIVSLPNCWRDARRPMERGKGEFAHYGLPLEKPLDRHKWFFSLSQAQAFLLGMALKYHLTVIDLFATEQQRPALLKWLRHLRYPNEAYLNRYAQTLWIVLSKETS